MAAFRVFMRPGGWRVTDGVLEHGPYPTYEQAHRTADNLNLQLRSAENPSFAPVDEPVWQAREADDVIQLSGKRAAAEDAADHAGVQARD